jgi:hypothetical protein
MRPRAPSLDALARRRAPLSAAPSAAPRRAALTDSSDSDSEEDAPLCARYSLQECESVLARLAADPAQHGAAQLARRRARWQARRDALAALAAADAPRVAALASLRFVLCLPPEPGDRPVLTKPMTWHALEHCLFASLNINSTCRLLVCAGDDAAQGGSSGDGAPLLPALLAQVPLPGLAEAAGAACADGMLPSVRGGVRCVRCTRAVHPPTRALAPRAAERRERASSVGAARARRAGARRRRGLRFAAATVAHPRLPRRSAWLRQRQRGAL